MSTPTFTKTGSKSTSSIKLDQTVFNTDIKNHDLLKQAYVAYLANGRENLAKTLKRGEVRGGGKKPWKQKGTGRARFGSIRVPIWRGGGITFGPLGVENYKRDLTTKAKRQAIRQALSLKSQSGSIVVVESFEPKGYKTAEAVSLLGKLSNKSRVLLVVEDKTPELVRSIANIQDVVLVQAMYVNVYDVLNADTIIFTEKALSVTESWLKVEGGKK